MVGLAVGGDVEIGGVGVFVGANRGGLAVGAEDIFYDRLYGWLSGVKFFGMKSMMKKTINH